MQSHESYAVQSEERQYDHVDGAEHFGRVRRAWGDFSRAVSVQRWVDGQGWEFVDAEPFQVSVFSAASDAEVGREAERRGFVVSV